MEVWKDIKGYEGIYQISNLGRVKSLAREVKRRGFGSRFYNEIILKQKLTSNGYPCVKLSKGSVQAGALIHRLVAAAFIPNPLGKRYVNHKDGVKTNHSLDNIEWCTFSENMLHAYATGLMPGRHGENNPAALLTSAQVLEIRSFFKGRMRRKECKALADRYGVSISTITNIRFNKAWKAA